MSNIIKLTNFKSCQPELVEGGLPDAFTPASKIPIAIGTDSPLLNDIA
jgi:hypothetical protein